MTTAETGVAFLDLVSAHARTRCLSMAAVLEETSVEWSR